MSQLFYKPDGAWAGDFIPFCKDDVFYLFYLRDSRDAAKYGEGIPWYLITTKDFVNFEEHGEVIPRGGLEEQDLFVFTGSVIEAEGKYHIFYTGNNHHLRDRGQPAQAIMHAESDDLIHWRKLSKDTFFAPEGYEKDDWRDPFVFRNEAAGEYQMLLAARFSEGAFLRRGCTALCVSDDLKNWQIQKPFWVSEMFYTHECPDLFKIGDWYYMIYSEYSDRNVTRYRMSRSINGPWLAPSDDRFDGRAFYAAKSAAQEGDGKRFLFGWLATQHDGNWQWGGNLVVHELTQRPDGTLTCSMPEAVEDSFSKSETLLEDVSLTAVDGFKMVLAEKTLSGQVKIDVDFSFDENTDRLGIAINYDQTEDNGYFLFIEPKIGRLSFEFWPNYPNSAYTGGCERHISVAAGETHRLSVLADDTCCVAYLNNQTALCGRMYMRQSGRVGAAVSGGSASFANLRLSTC